MTAKLFEHPFDLSKLGCTEHSCSRACQLTFSSVKVRLQSQPTDRPAAFTGPLDCFKQTFAKEGWKGLYRVSLLAVAEGTTSNLEI